MESNPVPLRVTINRQATDAIVHCTGRITSETSQSFKGTVKPLFSWSKRVVLVLTNVDYLDSSGLGAIIGLYVSARLAHCDAGRYCKRSVIGSHVITNPTQRLAADPLNVDWFRFWLQGYEDPDPAKAGQYTRWQELCRLHETNLKAKHAKESGGAVH